MSIERLVGLAAATLTTVSFVPQVYRSLQIAADVYRLHPWHSRDTSSILLWLVYGLLIHDLPVTLANAVTLVLALTVLALKLRYR